MTPGCRSSERRGGGTRPERGAAAGAGAAEDTLVVLYKDGDERIFGPYWDVEARFLMFQPLVTEDREGRIAPALARSWEHSEDYSRWTFHLRSDVRWHDGVPFTADDVKFTLDLCSDPDVLYEDQWNGLDSAVVRDDTTVSFFYDRPRDALDTWNVYFPKHLLEGLDRKKFFDWAFWTHPVGDGPYRWVRSEPKTMVEVEADPDFYGGRPRVDRIILEFGGASPLMALRSGEVDVLTWTNQTELPTIRSDPRFRVTYQLDPDVPWFRAIFWNGRRPPLGDRRVRRALTLALDRRSLMAALNLPADLPVVDGPFSARQRLAGRLPEALPYDTARAAALLAEAGWRDLNGDGMRERADTGGALRFELLAVSGDISEQAALLIQDAWRRVGVVAEIAALDRSLVVSRVQAGDYDAAILPYWNAPAGHRKVLGEGGSIGYSNPEMTRLLDGLTATVAPSARDSLYRRAAAIFRRDLPVTLLFPEAATYVADRRVRGLESPYRGDPLEHAEELWIEEESQ